MEPREVVVDILQQQCVELFNLLNLDTGKQYGVSVRIRCVRAFEYRNVARHEPDGIVRVDVGHLEEGGFPKRITHCCYDFILWKHSRYRSECSDVLIYNDVHGFVDDFDRSSCQQTRIEICMTRGATCTKGSGPW
jgi:hypothetical protein